MSQSKMAIAGVVFYKTDLVFNIIVKNWLSWATINIISVFPNTKNQFLEFSGFVFSDLRLNPGKSVFPMPQSPFLKLSFKFLIFIKL